MRLFGAIEKFDSLDDGTLIVSGYASSTTVDSDGEIVSAQAMKDALPDYMKFANLREMHQPIAAGKTILAEVLEDGRTFIKTHVIDKSSVAKVKAGVLKGFSIAGNKIRRAASNAKEIIGLSLTEISLVDRPANPECVFDVWKSDKESAKEDKGEKDESDDHYSKYGDVAYADKANHKYPIDTEAHVRAALSYFSMPKNRGKYSESEQTTIMGRIHAAAHKFGIHLSSDESKIFKSPEIVMIELDSKTLAKALGLPETASETELSGALLKRLGTAESPSAHPVAAQTPSAGPRLDEIQKIIDGATKPLMDKMTELEKRESAAAEAMQKAERAEIVKSASAEGKVIPLSDEVIQQTPIAVLKEMVSKLDKKVVLAGPRAIRPLDGKGQDDLRKSVAGASARAVEQHNDFFRKQFYPAVN